MTATNHTVRLLTELKNVSNSLQAILDASVDMGSEQFNELRQAGKEILQQAKTVISQSTAEFLDQTKENAQQVENYVKENPWKTLTLTAGVAALTSYFMQSNKF